MNNDDITRRGWEAETRRHRENLARALDEVQRVAANLSARVAAGETGLADEARRLGAPAVEAAQSAAAVDAADQLSFMLPGEA